LLAALHLIKLVARILPRIFGEVSQALERVPEESHWFHGTKYTGLDINGQARMLTCFGLSRREKPPKTKKELFFAFPSSILPR
jgi:hypothetical protein